MGSDAGDCGFYVSNGYKVFFVNCTATNDGAQFHEFIVISNTMIVRGDEECRLATMLEF